MEKRMATLAAAVLAVALAAPAFAGGDHCGGGMKASAAAWGGAWLQRSASGTVTVAEVAKGSPAARSGLRVGDVVLAVNGYQLADAKDRASCAASAECNVGSAVTYTVQRGRATKSVKLRLEKMPADAAHRLANRQATFDPALAAIVMPATN